MQHTLTSQMSSAADAEKIAAKLIPVADKNDFWNTSAQVVLTEILARGHEKGMSDADVRGIIAAPASEETRDFLKGTPAESILFEDARVGSSVAAILAQSI